MTLAPRGHASRGAWWLLLPLAGVMALVGAYLFGGARARFSSDDAARCLMAEGAARLGPYVPRDWVFNNHDLALLPPYTLNVLLYPILGLSFEANALAVFVTYLFVLACLAAFSHAAYGDLETTLVATTLLASGLSPPVLQYLIAEGGSYAGTIAVALCLYGLALRRPPAGRKERTIRAVLMASCAVLLTTPNPTRASVLVLAPLGVALAGVTLSSPYREGALTERPLGGVVLPVALGAVAGVGLHWTLLAGAMNVNSVVSTRLASLAGMANHALALPGAWLTFLQPITDGKPTGGAEHVLGSGGVLLAVWLVGSVAAGVWRPGAQSAVAVTAAWLAASTLAVPLGVIVAASSFYRDDFVVRYALLGIVLAVPVAVQTTRLALLAHRRWRASLTLVLVAYSLGLGMRWHSVRNIPGAMVTEHADRLALIEALRRNQVRQVLATYWNAYVLTVLSRGSIRALPVVAKDEGVVSYPHGLSYEGSAFDATSGHSAVVLADEESSIPVWEAVRRQFGSPRAEARSGRFRAWILDTPRPQQGLLEGRRIDVPLADARLRLDVESTSLDGPCVEPAGCSVRFRVRNSGEEVLVSRGSLPLGIGVQGVDASGAMRDDVARWSFRRPLAPGELLEVVLRLRPSADSTVTGYRVCLVQESVAWLCHRTRPMESRGGE